MKKRTIFGLAAAAVLIAAVIYLASGMGGPNAHVITMPSPTAESSGGSEGDSLSKLDITPETLKYVLEDIIRSDSFSRAYSVKTYWEGGESESFVKHWSLGDKTKLVIERRNETKNILICGNEVSIWYDGDKRALTANLSEDLVRREIDRFSGLLTYEDIYALDQDDILDAGYGEKFGQACIYAKYRQGVFNYVSHIYLAIDSGLLVSSETYDGDRLVNSMELLAAPSSTPEESIFELPF